MLPHLTRLHLAAFQPEGEVWRDDSGGAETVGIVAASG